MLTPVSLLLGHFSDFPGGGSGDCVYIVILPVSLVFIFFKTFLNLADVKKLLKFAFLDYKLV